MSLWRQLKPKSPADILSLCYALILIHATIIFGDFVVAPWMTEYYGTTMFDIVLYNFYGAFIYLNVIGNMLKIMLTNTSTVGRILPTLLKPGWSYCATCEANSPPRSFHCSTCNRCILKRDHHCMFTGKCIGYFNHRYYILLVIYAWLGAMFCLTYSFRFTWLLLGGFSWGNLLCFILPLVAFMCGVLEFYTSMICFITLLMLLFSTVLIFLMIWHSKHIYFNMTTFERRRDQYKYDLGWRENLKEIFGTRWYIAWLFPLIDSPMPGDGIEFRTKDCYENPKDL
ncbi:hypothetical protein FSP39_010908 [Pinctada imbricata]|uniref:Palmitoyltransferase n=1 Tax=Pinctada imbricata TaxID=66713 RepID=A0AA89BNC9_PINIB|nr:hypothetical protein FSP39_010908 [Pinctada imbricata]